MKNRKTKTYIIGQLVKTIQTHKVHFPYPNHHKLGIYTIPYGRREEQQMGYRKGQILKLLNHATTGDKWNGIWWAETKKKRILAIDQGHFLKYESSN